MMESDYERENFWHGETELEHGLKYGYFTAALVSLGVTIVIGGCGILLPISQIHKNTQKIQEVKDFIKRKDEEIV